MVDRRRRSTKSNSKEPLVHPGKENSSCVWEDWRTSDTVLLCLLTFPFIAVVPDRISTPSSKDSQRVDGFYRFVWRRSVSQYSVDYGIIMLLIRHTLCLELCRRRMLALQIVIIGPQFIRLNSVLHKHNIILKREAKRLAFGTQKLPMQHCSISHQPG